MLRCLLACAAVCLADAQFINRAWKEGSEVDITELNPDGTPAHPQILKALLAQWNREPLEIMQNEDMREAVFGDDDAKFAEVYARHAANIKKVAPEDIKTYADYGDLSKGLPEGTKFEEGGAILPDGTRLDFTNAKGRKLDKAISDTGEDITSVHPDGTPIHPHMLKALLQAWMRPVLRKNRRPIDRP